MVMQGMNWWRRYTCTRCGKVYDQPYIGVSCLVLHSPSECCHYGETEVRGICEGCDGGGLNIHTGQTCPCQFEGESEQ